LLERCICVGVIDQILSPRRVSSVLRLGPRRNNTHECLFALIPITLRLLQLFPRIELLELSRLPPAEVIQLFLRDLRLEVEVVEQTSREVLREREIQDGGVGEVRGEVRGGLLRVLLLLLLLLGVLLGLRPETCAGRLLLLLGSGCDTRWRRRGWGVVFPEILRVDVHVLLLLLLLLAIVCHAVESVHGGWVDVEVRSVHGRSGIVVLRVIAAADAVGGTDDGSASLDGTGGCWVAVPP